MSPHHDVAVLGAGPAGLATALAASRRGLKTVVLERADRVGGLASSFEFAGQRVDHGSHRLHIATPPAILAEVQSLLGDDLQWRPRNGRIRLEGRWLAFPLRPGDLLRHAPPSLALGALRDVALAPWRSRRPAPDTFAGRVRRGLGPTIATRFYEPYATKLWALDAHELSGELARRRVSATSASGLMRKVVGGSKRSTAAFWYPLGGFGRISEVLADAAVAAGTDLRLGEEVTAAAELSSMAPTIVSTLPAPTTVALYGDEVPTDVVHAAADLTYRAALLVYLVVPQAQYTAFDAHYLPDPAVPVARVSEPKNYRDDPDDPTTTTVLCAEVPADPGGHLWGASDAELGELVADSLVRSGLPCPKHVDVLVKRVANVYPVYRVGFEQPLARVERWAAERQELILVGRQALFAHDNTHHALAMGFAAASCLRDDGTVDGAAWSAAGDEFRHHVVED